jgi:uncharacterized Zn-binding protein involved in type VI secretion
MPAQGRLGDKAQAPLCAHGCPACPHSTIGPGVSGSPNVLVNSKPSLRVDDNGVHSACCGPNQWRALQGSETVFINGRAAFRKGDASQHCGGRGQLVEGSPNVMVGGTTNAGVARTDLANWRVDHGSVTHDDLAASDAHAATRAALLHAAHAGAGLVKKDCTHCDPTVSVAIHPDPDAQRANAEDDRAHTW